MVCPIQEADDSRHHMPMTWADRAEGHRQPDSRIMWRSSEPAPSVQGCAKQMLNDIREQREVGTIDFAIRHQVPIEMVVGAVTFLRKNGHVETSFESIYE